MKAILILGLTLLFALAVTFAPAVAGSDAKMDCAKKCQVTSCPMQQKANAEQAKAEEKKAGHECNYEGKCELVVIKVEDLSDGDVETKLTKTLTDTEGVVKVCAVDAKAGTASLCYDPDIVQKDDLMKTVTKAGFKASVETGSAQCCPQHK